MTEPRWIPSVDAPTLETIGRHRLHLIGVSILLVVALALALVGVTYVQEPPSWLRDFGGTANAVRASLLVLTIGFGLYEFDRERRFRVLERSLVNERVLASALVNRLNEITSLAEASRTLGRSLDLDEAIDRILKIGIELLEADEGSLMLAEHDGLVVAAADGRARTFTGQRVGYEDGPAGRVATTRQPVLLEGARGREGIRSALCVPMLVEDELIGVINLSVTEGARLYNEYDLRALGMFSEQAALAILRARDRRRDRVRADLAGDLQEPLEKVRRTVRWLVHEGAGADALRRAEALAELEQDVDRAVDLLRWLGARNADTS